MKLRVHMGALTRLECTKEIEVPDNTKESDFPDIARKTYDDTDGSEFKNDDYYWERGECWCERVK